MVLKAPEQQNPSDHGCCLGTKPQSRLVSSAPFVSAFLPLSPVSLFPVQRRLFNSFLAQFRFKPPNYHYIMTLKHLERALNAVSNPVFTTAASPDRPGSASGTRDPGPGTRPPGSGPSPRGSCLPVFSPPPQRQTASLPVVG